VLKWEFYKDWNVSEKKIYEMFDKAYENSATTPLIDSNAQSILKELNIRQNIDLVTARNVKYEQELVKRLDSLNIHVGIHYENLIHVKHKPYDIKLHLNYDFLIDDNPNLATSLEDNNTKTIILYDQPWNQEINETNTVIRVFNWKQIGKIMSYPLTFNSMI